MTDDLTLWLVARLLTPAFAECDESAPQHVRILDGLSNLIENNARLERDLAQARELAGDLGRQLSDLKTLPQLKGFPHAP